MKAIFTICSKNYIAQALTLKESAIKHNPDVDFYIFLSDLNDIQVLPCDLVLLNNEWITDWQQMAFKYNVIEFSTSIKPFCYRKLFQQGYQKVIYLDPDVYVTSSLNPIFENLNYKSVILTPHYNHIQEKYSGAVTEEELLFVGIYNLGFCAIKKSDIGNKIINWWVDRLSHSCYGDKWDGLHVDQKWMEFIPAFFPEDVLISHHPGINCAIWNLHERELIIDNNESYLIRDLVSGEVVKLIFFHFSGFDPFCDNVINRRHPKFNVATFPSLKPIIKEYIEVEYRNSYDKFSKLTYSFDNFSNGDPILPLHRRIYRASINQFNTKNPFDVGSDFYKSLQESSLLIKDRAINYNLGISKHVKFDTGRMDKLFKLFAIFLKSIIGVKYYYILISYLAKFVRLENQKFMLK